MAQLLKSLTSQVLDGKDATIIEQNISVKQKRSIFS